jgi:hypothetical protein
MRSDLTQSTHGVIRRTRLGVSSSEACDSKFTISVRNTESCTVVTIHCVVWRYEESTRLTYTGFLGELEHLKIKKRLIDEKFLSFMGECVFVKL